MLTRSEQSSERMTLDKSNGRCDDCSCCLLCVVAERINGRCESVFFFCRVSFFSERNALPKSMDGIEVERWYTVGWI